MHLRQSSSKKGVQVVSVMRLCMLKRPPKVVLGVGVALLLAVAIAALAHVFAGLPSDSPTGVPTPNVQTAYTVNPAEHAYSIDPALVTLTTADAGPQFPLVTQGGIGPTQRSYKPLPYQQQYVGGWVRYFMLESALKPPGRTEIDTYSKSLGIEPSDPPTIFGPFVTEHSGLFEIIDTEQSYHYASAAHIDYLCCDDGSTENYTRNYDNWQTYPIHIGDETFAWGGIRRTQTARQGFVDQEYSEQSFTIRWRRGPVVSTLFIRGAHDLTLDTGISFARLIDQRIVSALQQATKGAFHVSNTGDAATQVAPPPALCPLDGCFRERFDRV